MKKLVIIIVILLLILIGMVVYRNTAIKSNNQVNVQDVEKIETYITKIYMLLLFYSCKISSQKSFPSRIIYI